MEGASIGLNDGGGGGGGRFIEATQGSDHDIITCLASSSNWPEVNYRFAPPESSEHENFWKITASKTGGARIQIMRDTHVTGTTP
jgi:hypothetical protein